MQHPFKKRWSVQTSQLVWLMQKCKVARRGSRRKRHASTIDGVFVGMDQQEPTRRVLVSFSIQCLAASMTYLLVWAGMAAKRRINANSCTGSCAKTTWKQDIAPRNRMDVVFFIQRQSGARRRGKKAKDQSPKSQRKAWTPSSSRYLSKDYQELKEKMESTTFMLQ